MTRPCPFCGAVATAPTCASCARDVTQPRVMCGRCKRFTPRSEPACVHCGEVASSDLIWKVPLSIALMAAAIAAGVAIRLLAG